jgi:Hydrazine synthase alpha subunit middle domain
MDWLLKLPLNLRFLSIALVVPALTSCDAFDFNGENIAPASSFPIVYVKRSVQVLAEPIDPVGFVAGGDLYWRSAASASAEEINLTRSQTRGAGDVSSPEVSYDGSKVVFSMRRPADNSWNIWLLDVRSKQLTQVLADDAFDDLHPHFLVDGRIVFSSDRQKQSREQLVSNNTEDFSYVDPKGRHPASLLHVMNADGLPIEQISFHVGHDRDVTLLSNGKLMFNRWEATGRRNHFPIITMNPDGTAMETLYGAYSKGNSFFSPRQLPNGNLIAIHAPVAGSHGAGALIEININQFGDLEDRVAFPALGAVAQKQLSLNSINIDSGVSEYGRFLSPYPVQDNSNRVLLSWSASNRTDVNDLQAGTIKAIEGSPSYGVYIMDLNTSKMTPVVPAAKGVIAYDAIAIQSRAMPTQIDDAFSGVGGTLDEALETAGQGVIHVRSVYDTDSNNLFASSMMIASEGEVIALTSPGPGDTRTVVADIATMKNRVFYAVDDRPARFVRVTKSVAVPENAGQNLSGKGSGVMQQILGYSEVEADGSVLVKVPADTPVAISVLDAEGRAITNHTSWFQVRPGEVLECFGCHSPRRRAPLNVSPIAGSHPIVQLGSAQPNETMAKTRARELNAGVNDPDILNLDISYTDDVWISDFVTASSVAGTLIVPGSTINIDYTALTTPQPVDGVINFVDHIQPIFGAAGANCVACHDTGQSLPYLGVNTDIDGVLLSYKNLLQGVVDLDPVNPIVNLKEGTYLTQRILPYVMAGGPRDSSRNSYLTEKLFNTELRATRVLTGGTNHTSIPNPLNPSELRLMIEWMDIGANYYNSPFGADVVNIGQSDLSEVIGVISPPDFNEFKTIVKPILKNRCASCHKTIGNKSDYNQRIVTTVVGNSAPSENSSPRFVLTGNDVGDYQAAIGFIEDRSTPSQNSLITWPLSTGTTPVHPQISDGIGGFIPVLTNSDADYISIVNWIQ